MFFCVLVVGSLLVHSGRILARSGPGGPAGRFACGHPATLISTVQGPGESSPLTGAEVDVEGVVVGAFQKPGELGGLFVQEEDPDQDRNPQTSEGLFVFTRFPARVGDLVRVRGRVTEFRGLTELQPVMRLEVCEHTPSLRTAAIARLPLASADDFEAIENMRVILPQKLVITGLHQLWKFGELVVSSERLFQPTQLARPGEAALESERVINLDQLIIDDGRTGSNLPVRFNGQDNSTAFSASNPLRTGQAIAGLEGVMHYGFGHYRLQPTRQLQIDAGINPRSAAPDAVGGALRAAVFNVLSYFSTLNESLPTCGPFHDQRCRGANDLTEQSLQMQKLAAALIAIDADIFALIELENNSAQSLQDFTNALNSTAGEEAWDFVRTGSIGQDAIKVGLLFKPIKVTPAGHFAILNKAVDARFNDALNRPALAQTFRVKGSGSLLTVVGIHLKSKSCTDAREPETALNDMQSCFNHARTEAAAALADWALSNPTGFDDSRVLVLGDFNSYRMEDPIREMQAKGLIDLLGRSGGRNAYTYVYHGLAGTLDYAFASPALAMHVTGVTAWHINADESEVLDYRVKTGMPDAYMARNPYRSSDHDPVIVGLNPFSPDANYEKPVFEEDLSILRYTLLAGALVLFVVGARGLR